jgi:hypothetical protein
MPIDDNTARALTSYVTFTLSYPNGDEIAQVEYDEVFLAHHRPAILHAHQILLAVAPQGSTWKEE